MRPSLPEELMKAIEWQRALQAQREQHGKVVFSLTELANLCGQNQRSVAVGLHRLTRAGVLERYTDGRYGLPGAATIDDLLRSLDACAYITGMAALYRYQLITQVPTETVCFTNRRHNRSRIRETALGKLVFACVNEPVYSRPHESVVAGPEQALCDSAYTCRRQGLDAMTLITFRNMDRLDPRRLRAHLDRYPRTVAREVAAWLSSCSAR
jgi:hypothetical protein